MATNKVTLNNEVIIDISGDNVTEADVKSGKTFHKANGDSAVGSAALAKPEESKTVNLDFSGGNMTVSPAVGGVLSSVLINKPENLIPENVKKDVNIAGVTGTCTGGEITLIGTLSGLALSSHGTLEYSRGNEGEYEEERAKVCAKALKLAESGEVVKAFFEIEGNPQMLCDIERYDGYDGSTDIQTVKMYSSSTLYLYYSLYNVEYSSTVYGSLKFIKFN